MKYLIIYLLVFNALADVMIVNVFRPTIRPIAYTSQESHFLKALMTNPNTCHHQTKNNVFTRDYYLSKDQTTICEITTEFGKMRPEAFCGTGVIIEDNGDTKLVELIHTDANGTIYNMIRVALPNCPKI